MNYTALPEDRPGGFNWGEDVANAGGNDGEAAADDADERPQQH